MGPLDLLAASAKKLAVKDQNNDGVIDTDGIEAAALEALEAEDQVLQATWLLVNVAMRRILRTAVCPL